MSTFREIVNHALLQYVREHADSEVSEVLRVFEQIDHVLLEDQVSYGAEDQYTVKIIYRKHDGDTGTYKYSGTFGELIREIIEASE